MAMLTDLVYFWVNVIESDFGSVDVVENPTLNNSMFGTN